MALIDPNKLKKAGMGVLNTVVTGGKKAHDQIQAPFTSAELIDADPALIPQMADKISEHFKIDGYEVSQSTNGDEHLISLSKGNFLHASIGQKMGLNIVMKPQDGKVDFNASIGIFGKQALPTALTVLVAWPVAIAQIGGMVKQAKLDDKALALAKSAVDNQQ